MLAAKQSVRDRFRHLCGKLAKAGAAEDVDALPEKILDAAARGSR